MWESGAWAEARGERREAAWQQRQQTHYRQQQQQQQQTVVAAAAAVSGSSVGRPSALTSCASHLPLGILPLQLRRGRTRCRVRRVSESVEDLAARCELAMRSIWVDEYET